MNAAVPPAFCASAITCSAMVVLPDDSGPKISTTRPRGNPPTPSALSSEIEPLEITDTGRTVFDPSRRIVPLPNCFSIWTSAWSIVLRRSCSVMVGSCLQEYGGRRRRGFSGKFATILAQSVFRIVVAMFFRVVALALALSLSGIAQMRMSVEQLLSFLRSSIQLKQDDRQVADYVKKIKL